jgi:hypothetical protein
VRAVRIEAKPTLLSVRVNCQHHFLLAQQVDSLGARENIRLSRKSNHIRVNLRLGISLAALHLLTMSGAGAVGRPLARHRPLPSTPCRAGTQSIQKPLPCLPKDVGAGDLVEYGAGSKTAKVTVGKKLSEMKARCSKGKLLDRKGREIRFFHISCWGNPPPNYLEIQREEQTELAKLKQRFTVIVLGCDPFTQ